MPPSSSSPSSSSSWLNRLLFSIAFVMPSAVIGIAVLANREPDVVQPEVNHHHDGGGVLGVAWTLLKYAASGEVPVLAIGRDTVRRSPDEEQGSDVISVLRRRDDELSSHSLPPKTPSQGANSVASHRTGTEDDDDIGTSWYDDRTDEYRSTVLQKQQQLRGVQRLPQAIIIGVKKGGTRALLEFLRTHPDVRAPGPEIHFFDKNYHRGLDWYRSQMPPTLPGQMTVEKTPSYWITREVPARLFNMSRDVRLVVVVRDPLTRALSDYAQAVTKRPDVGPFERLAFLGGNASSSSGAAAASLVDASWGPIRIGLYARHLERWLGRFPRRSIHFVSGERLVSDPAAELAGVQDFLGLRRIITDKHFFFNATKGFPCLKKAEGSGGSPRCLGKTKGRPHPRVDEKVMRRLRDFYRPFNERFYQMSGINFNWP